MRRICWSYSAERRARLAIFVAAALAGCGGPAVDTRQLTLGDDCFRVPVANLAYFNAKSGRSATLMFSNATVRAKLPDYAIPPALANGTRDTLYVSVFLPTEAEAARIVANRNLKLDDSFYDLWYALDEFAGRTIEPIAGTSLFRVRPLADGTTWMVVTRVPDPATRDAHRQPGFWVATCSEVDAGRLSRCTAEVESDSLRLTLNTSEENLALRDSLTRFVIDEMRTWTTTCVSL